MSRSTPIWLAAFVGLGACALDPVSIADEQVDGDGGGDGMAATRGEGTAGDTSSGGAEASTGGGGNTSSTGGSDGSESDDGGTTSDGSGGSTTLGQLETCEDIIAAFEAETTAIRSCSLQAQCGQVLGGTSCGCTRNWVARLDADLEQWESLLALAGQMECELALGGPCDCPPADGYACIDNGCTWNYL